MGMHAWVSISYMPVIVSLQDDGTLDVHIEEMAEEIAKEEARLGCMLCNEPLTTESYATDCPGQAI